MLALSTYYPFVIMLLAQLVLPTIAAPVNEAHVAQPGANVLSLNSVIEDSDLVRRLPVAPSAEECATSTSPAPRVYTSSGPPAASSTSDSTLVSILFDTGLGWEFFKSPDSETQLFSWMPNVLATALNLPQSQVQTLALQAHASNDNAGPADVDKLQTMYLAYIPTSSVRDLASQLQTPMSAFYTALGSPYRDLAAHVDSNFDITSVSASPVSRDAEVSC